LLILCVALVGCAVPRPHEKVDGNLIYRRVGGDSLRLDLYRPRTVADPPVIVWFHGGGWKIGDKRIRLLIRDLTRDGYAVASVQYRLSGQALWPAQREDCLAAIHWLKTHGSKLGIDASRMALAGDSAGGHLAALGGLQLGRPSIRAVFAIYPPTDLVGLADYHRDPPHGLIAQLLGGQVSGRRSQAADASPVSWVSVRSPAFLFLHGDRDELVPLDQSRKLHRLVRQQGGDSQLWVAQDRGHGFVLTPAQLTVARRFFAHHLAN
jgi:acetyl esterase/lipase